MIKHLLAKNVKLYDYLQDKKYYWDYRRNKRFVKKHSAEALVRKMFKEHLGYDVNLADPKTFNEKLAWLKLKWYDERAIQCSNKHLAREFVKSHGLGDLLIKQCAVYDSPDEIDLSSLPDRFVLKTSHDSGHIIICKDKSQFDIKKARQKLKKWLSVDYEYMSCEWPYRSKKYIVCEEFIEDKQNGELFDYKFFCFNGKPEYIFFVSDRKHHAKSDFYDTEWNLQDFRWLYEPSGKVFPKPSRLNDMLRYSEILSKGFPFVRVDLYEVEGKVYFGEMTFFHGGGLGWYKPFEIDTLMGEKIALPPPDETFWHKRSD